MGPHSSLPQEEDEDEEDDEYFETSEDIASSSSDADSVGEGNYPCIPQVSSSSSSSSSFASKYEIWKAIPGSIAERRRRLRVQMGLIPEISFSSSSEGMTLTDQAVLLQKEQANHGRNESHLGEQVKNHRLNMVRSRSENGLEEDYDNGILSLSWKVRSSAGSPVEIHFSQVSRSPLVRKENKLERFSDSKETHFGTNTSDCDSSRKSAVAERFSTKGDEDQRGRRRRMMGSDMNGAFTPAPDIGGLCRIKDLDSGTEFVVNEVGKDGLWNRLQVLDTGKEMSLAEFESCLGLSPIVQEVMRREKVVVHDVHINADARGGIVQMNKKNKRGGAWLRAIKWVVGGSQEVSHHQGSVSDERDTSTEKSRRSESTADDCQGASRIGKPVKVHSNKKAIKEFAGLHMRQELQAHEGAIWAMRFSHDGFFLASAGQDKVVRVWEVAEQNVGSRDSPYSSGELNSNIEKIDSSDYQMNSEFQGSKSRSTMVYDASRPNKLFRLSEIPKCNFHGHTEDILDLSWSPSQFLLSSSMDKTVRLWNVSSRGCLKVFKHNDYVTCIQFNPLDDGHFISGSLDGKVRIWRIKEPQVVDWVDLQEMVTAACYTPNGQGALVGSYKGTCRFYGTSENKLQLDTTFEVRRKGKRAQGKKITGFQFIPGDKEKVLITSSDSRIRLYDGTKIIAKFKGFKNVKSQIAASFVPNGQYIICGSEDSRVCIWKYADRMVEGASRQEKLSYSYEHFNSKHVLVAISWPGMMTDCQPKELTSHDRKQSSIISSKVLDCDAPPNSQASSYRHRKPLFSSKESESEGVDLESMNVIDSKSDHEDAPRHPITFRNPISNPYLEDCCGSSMLPSCIPSTQNGSGKSIFFADSKGLATWPEEKLPSFHQSSMKRPLGFPLSSWPLEGGVHNKHEALGLVIVTASLEGDIRIFQNFGSLLS